jgi:hypothetical protein
MTQLAEHFILVYLFSFQEGVFKQGYGIGMPAQANTNKAPFTPKGSHTRNFQANNRL